MAKLSKIDCKVCVGKHVRKASGVVTNCCGASAVVGGVDVNGDDDGGGAPDDDDDGATATGGVAVVVVVLDALNTSYKVKFKFRTASSASTARVKKVISDRLYMATIFRVVASNTGMADK